VVDRRRIYWDAGPLHHVIEFFIPVSKVFRVVFLSPFQRTFRETPVFTLGQSEIMAF
jgi:hypothetical protein